MRIPAPADEAARLRLLAEIGLVDPTPDPEFDSIAWLAAAACGTPISLISFIDVNEQIFRARVGVAVSGTSRCLSFCAYAVASREILVIEDTLADPRCADNPMVMNEPKIRFYAGMPIFSREGIALGTLCVAGREPRKLDAVQAEMLRSLALRAGKRVEAMRTSPRPTAAASSAQPFKPCGWAA